MITKHPSPDGEVNVIFSLPIGTADHAVVVGDFNDWSLNATVMAHTDDGLEAAVTLERAAATGSGTSLRASTG